MRYMNSISAGTVTPGELNQYPVGDGSCCSILSALLVNREPPTRADVSHNGLRCLVDERVIYTIETQHAQAIQLTVKDRRPSPRCALGIVVSIAATVSPLARIARRIRHARIPIKQDLRRIHHIERCPQPLTCDGLLKRIPAPNPGTHLIDTQVQFRLIAAKILHLLRAGISDARHSR